MRKKLLSAGIGIVALACGLVAGGMSGQGTTDAGRQRPASPATRPGQAAGARRRAYPNDYATRDYEPRNVEGWIVYVHKPLMGENKALGLKFLDFLRAKLLEVKVRVPPDAVTTLQTIKIWVEDRDSKTAATYYWSARWLAQHGFNPDKAMSVHVCSASRAMHFARWQPSMILHELAHGYHQRVMSRWGPQIDAAYRHAAEKKLYEAVPSIPDRKLQRAYASKNAKEYFAETTEAYFALNDYYPFFWAQLEAHDPKMYELLGKIWQVKHPLHYRAPATAPAAK